MAPNAAAAAANFLAERDVEVVVGGIRVRERDRGTAGIGHPDRPAIVPELEQHRDRARGVARHGDDLDRHVADRDHAAVGAVVLRPVAGRVRDGAGQHARPVALAIDDGDARDGRLGQVGAAIMVAMGVRVDGIANHVGVEAQDPQALVDLSLGRVFEVAVDEDDLAGIGDQRVGVVVPRAEEVEVVADLRRLGIPVLPAAAYRPAAWADSWRGSRRD